MLREILKRHINLNVCFGKVLSYLLFLYFKIFLLSETYPMIIGIKFLLLAFHLQYKIPIVHKYIIVKAFNYMFFLYILYVSN